ncbi:MAG: hypothetical protein Q4D98_02975 [Planctomycetia bacterium]|nr:hypothetical protein [Planctomycetia bacterium]
MKKTITGIDFLDEMLCSDGDVEKFATCLQEREFEKDKKIEVKLRENRKIRQAWNDVPTWKKILVYAEMVVIVVIAIAFVLLACR